MPKSALKQPRRSVASKRENVELLNDVREELRQQECNAWCEHEQLVERITGLTLEQRTARWNATWGAHKQKRSHSDPLKALITKAALGNVAPLQKYLNQQTSGTGVKVYVTVPKKIRSRFTRGVPPETVKDARNIRAIMKSRFASPQERKRFWSEGILATILWFESEDPATAKAMIEDPTKLGDWPAMIDRRIGHGDEKRTWRGRSTGSTQVKNARMRLIK